MPAFVLDQVGELEGVHAAGAGAVFVVPDVPAADAVEDGHALGRLGECAGIVRVPFENLAAGGPGGVGKTFELQIGEHVGAGSVSQFLHGRRIQCVVARGQDARTHFDLHDLLFLGKVDGSGFAGGHALLALARVEADARLGIDGGRLGNGLGEGDVGRVAGDEPLVPIGKQGLGRVAVFVHNADGVFLTQGLTQAAADAGVIVNDMNLLLLSGDGLFRAFAGAQGAADAFFRVDLVVVGGGYALFGKEFIAHRTDLGAVSAARALVHVDVSGMLFDPHGEVADISGDIHDFAIGQQLDVLALAHRDHLGGADARGAVQGGEGLVELEHVPADGGGLFHQIGLVA